MKLTVQYDAFNGEATMNIDTKEQFMKQMNFLLELVLIPHEMSLGEQSVTVGEILVELLTHNHYEGYGVKLNIEGKLK